MSELSIKRCCYFPKAKPRVWWWKIVDSNGEIVSDGYSSKREAEQALAAVEAQHGS